jgi:hypothetical protein
LRKINRLILALIEGAALASRALLEGLSGMAKAQVFKKIREENEFLYTIYSIR